MWMQTGIGLTCQREIGNFMPRWDRPPLATPRLPSLFSKSIGFTLWGMVDDPISPALVICTDFWTAWIFYKLKV